VNDITFIPNHETHGADFKLEQTQKNNTFRDKPTACNELIKQDTN
jgi:hypothetical protein